MSQKWSVGAGHWPARHFAPQNAFAVRRKNLVSLRENRKSVICGGRAGVPPLQVFLETGAFDSLESLRVTRRDFSEFLSCLQLLIVIR